MKIKTIAKNSLSTAAFLLLMTACKDSEPAPQPDVKLGDTALGEVLTDSEGKSLYFFSRDVGGDSKCIDGCLANWPVFLRDSTLEPGEGLDATEFTTIIRPDGTLQTAYKGWPLYYFVNDNVAGDVNGEGVNNVWFLAKTKYTIMVANGQLIGNDGKSYKGDYTEGTENVRYFTDGHGRTLYTYVNDRKDNNNFTSENFSNDGVWPVYTAEIDEIPSTLDRSLFKVIDVFNRKQLTYKGWPLYYFGADNDTRGATKGVSVPRPGVWPVARGDMQEAPVSD